MPIRIRLALLFALAAAVAVSAGSLIYVHVLTAQLHATIDAQLEARAGALRPVLDRGSAAVVQSTVASESEGGQLTQVITRADTVVAASASAGRAPLLTGPALEGAARSATPRDAVVGGRVAHDEDSASVRLLVRPAAVGAQPGFLLVGASLGPTDDAIDRVTDGLGWAGPITVVLAALAGWLLAAASLRPVERMRRQAAAMSAEDSTTGIAEPRTRDELAALARTMNDLLLRLHGALERERAFVADAGHELRTPLAILRAELELAARPGRSVDELRAAVGHAAEEADRLGRLANDLLGVATGNPSETVLLRSPVEVGQLVREALTAAGQAAGAAAIELTAAVSAGLVADIDPGRVRRLVDNLVDNALRATPAGGRVVVTAAADGEDLVISVRDTGPGFPPAFLPVAFDRFSRADSARDRQRGGAGLGLAIVRTIAEAHGGRATATNDPAGGAVVTVALAAAVLTVTALE